MKDKEYHVANFATFFSKTVTSPPTHPPKWMNLISDRLSNTLIKYSTWSSPVFGRFQNRCNKVVIEPRVVQLWSEIILVISNRTHAARSFDFKITHNFSPNCTQFSSITIIKLGVESNPTSLCDWSWELPPFSQPIRRKTKTNHEMVVRFFFPPFRPFDCSYFKFSLTLKGFLFSSDWPPG